MYRIDLLSRIPIYEQIIEQTKRFIAAGVLKPGDALPSVRSLSNSLHANPNTVARAFTELDRAGIICTVQGKGCFVKDDAKKILQVKAKEKLKDVVLLCEELIASGVDRDEIIAEINKINYNSLNKEDK